MVEIPGGYAVEDAEGLVAICDTSVARLDDGAGFSRPG
jgi:hypothetical protein